MMKRAWGEVRWMMALCRHLLRDRLRGHEVDRERFFDEERKAASDNFGFEGAMGEGRNADIDRV
jgi:hypothetical protein